VNASSGEISARFSIPIATPRGSVSTRRKSAVVSASPRLVMISASAPGSSRSVSSAFSIVGRP
jgi:hypothetical protein